MSMRIDGSGLRDMRFSVRAVEGSTDTLVFRGATEDVASDGGVLLADGMGLSRFERNPVVLWNHGNTLDEIPVIGRAVKWALDGAAKAWDFTVQFAVKESELAAKAYRLAKAGFLVAASVGFRVTKFRELTDTQREQMGLDRFGWVGEKWDLHELSLVPVGADPSALKRAIDAGELLAGDFEMIGQRSEIAQQLIASIGELTSAVKGLHAYMEGGSKKPMDDEEETPEGDEPEEKPETGGGEKPKIPSAGESDSDEEEDEEERALGRAMMAALARAESRFKK